MSYSLIPPCPWGHNLLLRCASFTNTSMLTLVNLSISLENKIFIKLEHYVLFFHRDILMVQVWTASTCLSLENKTFCKLEHSPISWSHLDSWDIIYHRGVIHQKIHQWCKFGGSNTFNSKDIIIFHKAERNFLSTLYPLENEMFCKLEHISISWTHLDPGVLFTIEMWFIKRFTNSANLVSLSLLIQRYFHFSQSGTELRTDRRTIQMHICPPDLSDGS